MWENREKIHEKVVRQSRERKCEKIMRENREIRGEKVLVSEVARESIQIKWREKVVKK